MREINDIQQINFYYSNSVETDSYKCGDCIQNTKVTHVDLSDMCKYITDKLKITIDTVVDAYCIDRILRINKMFDINQYWIDVVSGYYGEEIGGIYFSGIGTVISQIKNLYKLTSIKEKMEYVLNLEYGYILPSLKDKEWCLETINKSDVVIGNDSYHKKVESAYYYKKFKLPICVVLSIGDIGKNVYRLIDGYHRFVSLDSKSTDISVIIAS